MNTLASIVNIEERRPVVKADIENGYDRLAHTLTNTLMVNDAKLSAREMQVVFAIISKTYRFQKKEDWIANAQICELTKLSKGHVSNLMKSLMSKKVITKNGRNIGINNKVSEWKVHSVVNNHGSQIREQKFTNSCAKVHRFVNNSSLICETHKKETITKEEKAKSLDSDESVLQEIYKLRNEGFEHFIENWKAGRKLINSKNPYSKAKAQESFNKHFTVKKIKSKGQDWFNDQINSMSELIVSAYTDLSNSIAENSYSEFFNFKSMQPPRFISNKAWDNADE